MYVCVYWGEYEFMMVDMGGLENLSVNFEGGSKTDIVGGVEILFGMIEV